MDGDDSNLNCKGTGLQTCLPMALYDSYSLQTTGSGHKNRRHHNRQFNFGEDWRRRRGDHPCLVSVDGLDGLHPSFSFFSCFLIDYQDGIRATAVNID